MSTGVLEEEALRTALQDVRNKQHVPKSRHVPKVFALCFFNTPWPRPTSKVRAIH